VQNTPAATLNSLTPTSTNTFAFQLTGISGFTYVVQASTNLADWIPVATNASPFIFVDPESSALPQRFYRAVWSP